MFSLGVVAHLYLSLLIGFLARPLDRSFGLFPRVFATWATVGFVAFIVQPPLVAFIVIALIYAGLSPRSAVDRVCFFLATFPALPTYFQAMVPFPGLNYLLMLDVAKVSSLVVLGPVFVSVAFRAGPPKLRALDTLVFIFFLMTSVMTIRQLPFTSMLRATVDQFLLILVPYICVSRTLLTVEDFSKALRYVYVSILIAFGIAAISSYKTWNFFIHLPGLDFHIRPSIFRDGYLRIEGTLSNVLHGYLLGIGAIMTWRARQLQEQHTMLALVRIVLLVAACYLSLSRGAWLAAMYAAAAYVVFTATPSAIRRLFVVASAVGGVFLVQNMLNNGVGAADEHATIQYRVELLRAGLDHIADYPIFGRANYQESWHFLHLYQGQGIIDFVNSYLQIALGNGLVGLGLFAVMFAMALGAAMKSAAQLPNEKNNPRHLAVRTMGGLVIATILGMLVMISTTSITPFTTIYLFVFLAMGKAYAYAAVREVVEKPASPERLSEARWAGGRTAAAGGA